MKSYWYRRVPNFGDRLAPILLEHSAIEAEWAPPVEAELVTVGSVLQGLPRHWPGIVLGSGLIAEGRFADIRHARVLGVRGELTRDALGLPRGTFLADPGILAGELLVGRDVTLRNDIAVAPHYVDDELVDRFPDARRIDVQADPVRVLEAIAAARLVITSSLHVAIAADALGVLHVIEPHRDVVGGLFKFRDYVSAFGATVEPGIPRLTSRSDMTARQAELRDYYLSLPAAWRAIA
ncbi:MAG TPA: polysaccharide pyruvyl transferase family protein [Candidatus Limnocylindrales bacterium]|nr:polysaccharide pyruvyl transferase family protein [Candidatus Limnocylindrales bacterium]